MERIDNQRLAPYGSFPGDYPSEIVPTSQYFYSVTGDVIPGSNVNPNLLQEYSVPSPMGTATDIRNQVYSWDLASPETEAEASWDLGLNFVAPVVNFFQNVVESFTGGKKKPEHKGKKPIYH